MAAGGEQGNASDGGVGADLYAVLGLKKECSAADLRSAYKKLALRWHPDRCSASGSSKTVEEAKTKFQAIQEAYSVLSDTNKRFLYDVGVYDDDDDAAADVADGMSEFMCEMAAMMSQANRNPCESGSETFEQLQELFVEMFQADGFCDGGGGGGGETTATASRRGQGGGDGCDRRSTSSAPCFSSTSSDSTSASFYGSCRAAAAAGSLKRDSADMCSGKAKGVAADTDGAGGGLGPGSAFCFGTNDRNSSSTPAAKGRSAAGKRRGGGKPKASSRHDGPSPQAGETPATE